MALFFPEVEVDPDSIDERDGDVWTSAGVSAGIDMALWLVGEPFGPLNARLTQKVMEYDPAPPYTAEV